MLPVENILSEAPSDIKISKDIKDYAEILKAYQLEYKEVDYYLQVGTITKVQGWILHVSVILSQIPDLFELLIPVCIAEKVAFKIPANHEIGQYLLTGACGYINLGKIVCVYPESDDDALVLARKLISLTMHFRGPAIPTDRHLGAVVYTRYGSFNPVLRTQSDGSMGKYIYNPGGELVPDNYGIPFTLTTGIKWPFDTITDHRVPARKGFMNDCIKPVAILKSDVKGRVIKGLYFKSWFKKEYCLIKEGKKNMCADESGRDIQTRLEWQLKLHRELEGVVPIPKILDIFREEEDLYLVMEYINGISLYEQIMSVYGGVSWRGIDNDKRVQLLDYLLSVIHIVDCLHKKGYVHRDLSPVNFLLDRKGKLYMIDLELVYCIDSQTPSPAFGLATMGFMSPEQLRNNTPTFKEDIYALGAFMITLFTGMEPLKFETTLEGDLSENLMFFIPERKVVNLISSCLQKNEDRPELGAVYDIIRELREQCLQKDGMSYPLETIEAANNKLNDTIYTALNGLGSELMTSSSLWVSKTISINSTMLNPQSSYSFYPGMYEGISGVLYMLSEAKYAGIKINNILEEHYQQNMAYIQKQYLNTAVEMPAGLYNGRAGIALTIASGIKCGLQADTEENRAYIRACLDRVPEGLDLANGVAGQGLALLKSRDYIEKGIFETKLGQMIEIVTSHQQKDGSWAVMLPQMKKAVSINGFAVGNAGITYFLLKAAEYSDNDRIKISAVKALSYLLKQAQRNGPMFNWPIHSATKEIDPWMHLGIAGIAFTFIKAYELFKEPIYQEAAEGALRFYPSFLLALNLGRAWGCSGLGEVYLEAWRVLRAPEWKLRADWIAGTLVHLQKRVDENISYWQIEALDALPTADLMTGNSGVIRFLIRKMCLGKMDIPLM